MDNVLINFQSNTGGLQAGVTALEQVEAADKSVAEQAQRTAAEFAKQNAAISASARASGKSVDALATSLNNIGKVQIGGTFLSTLKAVNSEAAKLTTIRGANVPFVDDVAKRLKFLQGVAQQTNAQLGQVPATLSKIKPAAGATNQALMNTSRVLQDLPYGFMGIANNLDPLLESFTKLRKETGSTGGALQAMVGGLTGPAGIGIALAVVSGLIIAFGDELADMFADYFPSVERAAEKQKKFNDTLKEANEILVTLANSYAKVYTDRTREAEKALSLAQAEGKSEAVLYKLRQDAIVARRLENIYKISSLGLTEEDVKLNEANLQLLNEQLQALKASVNSKGELSDADEARAKVLESQIGRLKSITDPAREALNGIREAQAEAEKEEAERARRVYENSVKSSVAAVEARVAASKRGSKEEMDAQIAAIKARVDAEKKLNVNLTTGERVKLEQDAQKEIQNIRFEFQKRALQDAKLAIDAQVLQAKEGSQEEFDFRVQQLEAARQIELKDQELTNNKKAEINARYRKQELELARAFNLKVQQDSLNTSIAQTQDEIASLQFNKAEETNADLLALRQKLIDDQAALEVAGVNASEKNEELRRSKIKLIYDKALFDKQELERKKNEAEINRESDSAIDPVKREIDRINAITQASGAGEQVRRAARKQTHELTKEILDEEERRNKRLLENQSISEQEYNRRRLDNAKTLADQEIQIQADKIARQNELFQMGADATQQIADVVFQNSQRQYDEDMAANQERYDQKLITEKEFNAKQEQIERARAQSQKLKALFDIGIDLAKTLFQIQAAASLQTALLNPVGVAAALSQIPLVLAQAGLATALVAARKYRHGEIDIDGPGTKTSDSIFARISKGESVINADMTAKHKEALEAINENKFEKYLSSLQPPSIPEKYQMPALSTLRQTIQLPAIPKGMERRAERKQQQGAITEKMMERAMTKALKKNPSLSLSFDKDGFNAAIREGIETINIKNRKLMQ